MPGLRHRERGAVHGAGRGTCTSHSMYARPGAAPARSRAARSASASSVFSQCAPAARRRAAERPRAAERGRLRAWRRPSRRTVPGGQARERMTMPGAGSQRPRTRHRPDERAPPAARSRMSVSGTHGVHAQGPLVWQPQQRARTKPCRRSAGNPAGGRPERGWVRTGVPVRAQAVARVGDGQRLAQQLPARGRRPGSRGSTQRAARAPARRR